MASARIRIELDHGGMEDMLKSGPVEDALGDIAEHVAVTAYDNMPTHDTGPLSYEAFTETIDSRVVGTVKTAHMLGPAIENKYAPLRNAAEAA
ncbi:hypothetical protein ACFQS3_02640 [Glycomyces mayteni]|uniref:Uncharacterized protein n=1 Tax=Glycomyces mayteni TaxID=543887 RepID=A0ABW2D1D3_9ACTN